MDYTQILKDIKPTHDEQNKIQNFSNELINYLQNECDNENINLNVSLVGSVAKNTALKGKSDIDIFIAFPLETDKELLKKTGLKLAHKCCNKFNGIASHHYASHPYVTADINGYDVDIVPCYAIKDGGELKSAVDRTILHTRYVKKYLKKNQEDEVLLLKQFMTMTGTYGSEFKVGGFAGYLCELLIIYYGTFENTLKSAINWKYGERIDLNEYGTCDLFDDPLIVIDPTDKNRNVAAALRIDKMAEFIQSARNYLISDKKSDYFYPLNKSLNKRNILNEFNRRNSDLIAIRFNIPNIPSDTLHPQLRKTCQSLENKLNKEEFNVFKSDYWSDEENYCIILLEMASSTLNNIKVNIGPKVFINEACNHFTNKYGVNNCYIQNDFLVHTQKREFTKAEELIKHIFTKDKISLIKVGKNLKNNLINTYKFIDLEEIDLTFLDDFINPGQYIVR